MLNRHDPRHLASVREAEVTVCPCEHNFAGTKAADAISVQFPPHFGVPPSQTRQKKFYWRLLSPIIYNQEPSNDLEKSEETPGVSGERYKTLIALRGSLTFHDRIGSGALMYIHAALEKNDEQMLRSR